MTQRLMSVVAVLAACAAMVAAGCDRAAPAPAGSVRVVVTMPPLLGLVRPLLPPGGSAQALITPGRSEHGYELTTADVAALARADVVVYVGLGLEPQVESFLAGHSDPHRQVVCFAKVVGIRLPPGAVGRDEHGDHEDAHDHGRIDPHLWLDPDLVMRLVPAIANALTTVAPAADAGAIAAASSKLRADVGAFDAEARATLAPFAGRAIVTHHAAWGRFAAHYGLKVAAVLRPIEVAEPTPADINGAVSAIRDQGAGAIFVEPQFSADAARRIAAEANVKLGTLDPLGDGDWFKMMRSNVDALATTLGH